MKTKFVASFFLSLCLAVIIWAGMNGSAFGAIHQKTFKFTGKALESRADCVITFLRQELNREVPEDFKTVTGLEELLKQLQVYEVQSDEEQRALNEAVKQILRKLLSQFQGEESYRQILLAMLAALDELPEGYCEPEAYEAEGPLRIYGRDLYDQRDEYKDDPVPKPQGNFIYYGKKYTLPDDITTTNNGLLLLSDEDFLIEDGETLEGSYPPAIAPLWVLTLDSEMEGGKIPVNNLFDEPSVIGTDSFFRYAYTPNNFSATLYTNPKSAQSDWIVFSYGDIQLPQDALGVFVGITPGDGKENHPGPGKPRSIAERLSLFGVDLSEEIGESFDNDPGSYLTIGEGFVWFLNPFDLSDKFLIFRPDGDDRYTVTTGTRNMVVDSLGFSGEKTSLDMAIENVRDENLLSEVDSGEYTPSNYEFGIQALTDSGSLQRLNENGLLAYAVQVEEDRLNKKILEMYEQDIKDSIRRENVINALKAGDIRTRDALLTQEADAKAGRVTKDHEGNWVRAQQYVLRPDAKTVKVLNVCLRGQDAGSLSGLSTMDFTTILKTDYQGDLRALPWGKWLDTERDLEFFGDAVLTDMEFDSDNETTPQPREMYVQFKNPAGEAIKFNRKFGEEIPIEYKNSFLQPIAEETLSISSNKLGSRSYAYSRNGGSGTFSVAETDQGIEYVLSDSGGTTKFLDIALYLADDYGTRQQAIAAQDEYEEIWDALRVNEPDSPSIGSNNLEISIDEGGSIFAKPLDLVYIPMARMEWKDMGE